MTRERGTSEASTVLRSSAGMTLSKRTFSAITKSCGVAGGGLFACSDGSETQGTSKDAVTSKKKRMVLPDALVECARDTARNIIVPLGLPKLLIGENHRQITLVGVLRTEGRRTDNHSYRHRLPSSN